MLVRLWDFLRHLKLSVFGGSHARVSVGAGADLFILFLAQPEDVENFTATYYRGNIRGAEPEASKFIIVRASEVEIPFYLTEHRPIDLFRDIDLGLCDIAVRVAAATKSSIATFDLHLQQRHGTIIDVSGAVTRDLISFFAANPLALKRIDRRAFEELVAELFDGFGYDVQLTARTRDGGRDVIAVGGREVRSRYLIECKRPDDPHRVGVSAVRELFGVKQDDPATKALLVTSTSFSADALMFFERHRWELEPRDFYGVMEWVHQYLADDVNGG